MIDNISWIAIYPEIVLLTMACVIALVDLGVHSPRRTGTYVLTMLTLAVVATLQADVCQQWQHVLRLWQYGRERRHGQLAQVFCHRGHDGHPGLRPSLCGRPRHAARR